MPEFLVEAYSPSPERPPGGPGPDDVARAADELGRDGHDVRLVNVVVVPDDEVCLYVFDAPSPEVVTQVAARAGLRFERLVQGVCPAGSRPVAPPGHARPSRPGRPGGPAGPSSAT